MQSHLSRKTKEINEQIENPQNPRNRVIAQKSIFVRPPYGFIEQYNVIDIPKDLKQPILDYLRKCHGISIETIYNDLHGFIRYQKVAQRAHAELYVGRTDQSEERYQQAIEHYTKAIQLDPQMARAYYNRGNAESNLSNYKEALKDYSKAIQLDPYYSESFLIVRMLTRIYAGSKRLLMTTMRRFVLDRRTRSSIRETYL